MDPFPYRPLAPDQLADAVAEALNAQRIGQSAALVAWRYAMAVEAAKFDLENIRETIRQGALADAFALAHAQPPLDDIVSALARPDRDAWRRACETFGRPVADRIDSTEVEGIASAFPAVDRQFEWLLSEYRKRKASDDTASAYPLIRCLKGLPAATPASQLEYESARQAFLHLAEQTLEPLLKENDGREAISNELEFFRAYELELEPGASPIIDRALAEEKEARKESFLDRIREFLGALEAETLHAVDCGRLCELEDGLFGLCRQVGELELEAALPSDLISGLEGAARALGEARQRLEEEIQSKRKAEDGSAGAAPAGAAGPEAENGDEAAAASPEPAGEANPAAAAPRSEAPLPRDEEGGDSPDAQEEGVAPAPEPAQAPSQSEPVAADEPDSPAPEPAPRTPEAAQDENAGQDEAEPEEEALAPAAAPSASAGPEPSPDDEAGETKAAAFASAEAALSKGREQPRMKWLIASVSVGGAAAFALYFGLGVGRSTPEEPAAETGPEAPSAPATAAKTPRASSQPIEETASPQEPWSDPVYDYLMEELETLASKGYAPERESEFETLALRLEERIEAMPEGEAEKARRSLREYAATIESQRNGYAESIANETDQAIETLREALRSLESEVGADGFDEARRRAADALAQAELLAIRHRELSQGSPARIDAIEAARADLNGLLERDARIGRLRGALDETDSVESYFEGLAQLADAEGLPDAEGRALARAASLRDQLPSAFERLRPSPTARAAGAIAPDFLDERVALAQAERVRIEWMRELASRQTKTLAVEELRYEGSFDPDSKRLRHAIEPPVEDAGKKDVVSEARLITRDDPKAEGLVVRTYLIDESGRPWGRRYGQPSETAEGRYAARALLPALDSWLSGAKRGAPARLLDALQRETSLSPLFRGYWARQLLGLMGERPKVWGLAHSPTLQEDKRGFEALPEIGPNEWVFGHEGDSSALPAYASFVDSREQRPEAADELAALAALDEFARRCSFELIGHLGRDQRPRFRGAERPSEDSLWMVNPLTGAPQAYRAALETPPYAPLMAPRLDGQGPDDYLESVRVQWGVDLSDPRYREHLPEVFRG